jgi:uncharacterized protein YecE (DUF72 family)
MSKPKSKPSGAIRVGCAGWSVPKKHADRFPSEGTHLMRYASMFPAVEINSSFYKPHKPATYKKWAQSVPEDFRFAVKLPKEATHIRRLADTDDILACFLSEVTALGQNLGPLLVQLPPSLKYDAKVAETFFTTLRERFDGTVVLEPRHATWFTSPAEHLATTFRVARVTADPAVVAEAAVPGGWDGVVYYRLHGSPKIYYSDYPADDLGELSAKLSVAARSAEVWCIFDNTADGAATANAFDLLDLTRA